MIASTGSLVPLMTGFSTITFGFTTTFSFFYVLKFLVIVIILFLEPIPMNFFLKSLPILNDMDGRVLEDIFESDSEFARREPKYVDPKLLREKEK